MDLVAVAARAAARAAGFLRAARAPTAEQWTEKHQRDFVTDVDRGAEAQIAESLTTEVPGSVVLGEELSPDARRGGGEVVWIVDPLDGTTNFLHGYPQFAVSIGCVVNGELCVGVIHDVVRDLVYRGATGHGAWLGEDRLAVSELADPRLALVGTGFPYRDMDPLARYLRQLGAVLRGAGGVRRAGAASLDLADVARGRFDGFWELRLAPWDVAAGTVLVREAGGVVTTLEGHSDILGDGSIVAGSPAMHGWLIDVLRNA